MISIILNIGVHIYIYKLNQSYWYRQTSYWIYWIFQGSQFLLKWSEIHQFERNLLPYNLEPSRNNLPPTVPPTAPPQKTTPCRQEALLALCQQQGFDAVSLVTCVGSLQKATTTEGRDLEMRHVWLQDLEVRIYIYTHIIHVTWRIMET